MKGFSKENFTALDRIILVVLVSSFILVTRNILLLVTFVSLLSLILIFFKGVTSFASRLKPLLFIAVMIIIFNLLFNGEFDFYQRILNGLNTALKITSLSLVVFLYTQTTSPRSIINGLFFLPKSLRLALTVTFSLIPILIEEFRTIDLVQKSRGYRKKFLSPLHNILPIVIPLLHRTFKRAEQLSIVILTRGYG